MDRDKSMMNDNRVPKGFGGLFYGVYPALVTDVVDPDEQGRVKVQLPWSPDGKGDRYHVWARLATLMAGNNQGSWFIPDVDEEVLIVFQGGNPSHPYVIGALWNSQDLPPESMDSNGKNNKKTIRSRSGIQITLDDSNEEEQIILKTPGGQEVTLKDSPGRIEARDSNGNTVTMDSSGITVNASMNVTINASYVDVTASMLNVNAGISRFSGLVQADSMITNSIVSASYSPGAGNIW